MKLLNQLLENFENTIFVQIHANYSDKLIFEENLLFGLYFFLHEKSTLDIRKRFQAPRKQKKS